MSQVQCNGCGHLVEMQFCFYGVTGYERPREAGGTNAVVCRERTGTILCGSCVAVKKSGGDPKTQIRMAI